MTRPLVRVLSKLLPRRVGWRLGRAVYLQSRRETPDYNIATNGEADVQRAVIRAARSSGTPLMVFDVGANIGEWSESFLDLAADGAAEPAVSVHAFEPVAGTFETLQNRLRAHPLASRFEAHNVALSNRTGSATMFVARDNAGTNSMLQTAPSGATEEREIRLDTADCFCEKSGIERLALLKCDAEGHDMAILEGAAGLIRSERVSVVQFEYNWRWIFARSYLKDVFDLVEGTPYRVGKIVPGEIEIYPSWHAELEKYFEANYLIVHETALDWFVRKEGGFDRANTYD